MSNNYSKVPRLIAFDLDGTIWSPDMYMLWGGGAPFAPGPDGGRATLVDKTGATVRMLGISGSIMHDMKYSDTFSESICALVSCTDEPSWAAECLQKFKTFPGDEPLHSCVDSSQIYKANKQQHFRALQMQYPDISFSEMMFFDNEMHNVTTVRQLGVHSICCPDGMTEQVWMQALEDYASS
mmetsp:Transcript_3209/g.5845  ORF Transcript_3209/g.5845 Transcript_3209/m.5845 type:complete len:182 (+) Transcript_3209:115-660(+)|eukprot:CAMPEP_0114434240 /NCGR_PEP_ID=MMETSP0103-20121206/12150_1 /TAXON_ID=37642 ORGANISM="Paraphysomonas imperforata, Strain PA2" /NCGR_SAMPLE_ID=MMETSP0103 /ASSEMBLY_ACC=CAM_ASM_000201 /LENGTH=181 /DNA_ID=CAMNT_0001604103 /DNA_START=116 /DNA_END=661 /DNA_ORIENTATION=-